jgi:anti-anti-sigma factor
MKKGLDISKRHEYGHDIIDLAGEINFEDSRNIEVFIKTNLTMGAGALVLNLERVPFINSSALSLLVKLMQELSLKRVDLYLMNPTETVMGLLEMTGVKKYFKFIKSENSLLDKLKKDELNDILSVND